MRPDFAAHPVLPCWLFVFTDFADAAAYERIAAFASVWLNCG
jgi:hypothetical protein